jgi:hypothetical protein
MVAGGWFGMISATCGWYLVCAGIWNKGNSWITLPIFPFPWAEKDHDHAERHSKDVREFEISHPQRAFSWPTEGERTAEMDEKSVETKTKPRQESMVRPKSFALPADAVARPKSLGLPPFYSYMYMQSRKI